MKRDVFSFVFLMAVVFAVWPEPAFSHSSGTLTGTPTIYNVTFKRFEIRNTSGSWVVIRNEDQTFNIASQNAGQQIGSYASGNFPVGTYDRVRVTVSATLSIKGFVYDSGADRTYYTIATGTNSVAGSKTAAEVNGYADYDTSSFTVTDMIGAPEGDTLANGMITHEEADDFTITAGQELNKTLYVDVTNTLQLHPDHLLYPGPFTVDDTA